MSQIDIKIYNILVHYGERNERNFLELLEDGLLVKLLASDEAPGERIMYAADVNFKRIKDRSFLSGYFYRSSTLKWELVPNANRKHTSSPGQKEVLPCARFFIDLNNHRLFWATKRGLTHSPSAFHFRHFIRKIMLPELREKYTVDAEIAWMSYSHIKGARKRKFIAEFLSSHAVTSRTFRIEMVPEVSKEKVIALLKKKNMILKKAAFKPQMNNVTKKDLVNLFTTAGKLEAETRAKGIFKLDPVDKKRGLEKKPIFKLLNDNESAQVLKFEFTLKDDDKPNERQFTIANTNEHADNQIQRAETIETGLEDKRLLQKILKKGGYLARRILSSKEREMIIQKIKELFG